MNKTPSSSQMNNQICKKSRDIQLLSEQFQKGKYRINESFHALGTSKDIPDCLFYAVEKVSRFLGYCSNFDRLYGEHGFKFNEKESNRLDIEFSRYEPDDYFIHNNDEISGYVAQKLHAIYGIMVQTKSFTSDFTYLHFIALKLQSGLPVIGELDIGRLPYRKSDYLKNSGIHIVIFTGIDFIGQKITIEDQSKEQVEISFDDFFHSFEIIKNGRGMIFVYNLVKSSPGCNRITPSIVYEESSRNIAGQDSNKCKIGVNAINDFLEYIKIIDAHEGSCLIPGVWVFSKQRSSTIKWLSAVKHDLSSPEIKNCCDKLIETLRFQYMKWRDIDFMMEISSRNCRIPGKEIRSRLIKILKHEKENFYLWEELYKAVKREINTSKGSTT